MDLAIINRSEKEELSYLKEAYIREDEIPFDFSRRRMSVVLRDKTGKRQLITKGAVEEILSICSFIELDGEVKEIKKYWKESQKKDITDEFIVPMRTCENGYIKDNDEITLPGLGVFFEILWNNSNNKLKIKGVSNLYVLDDIYKGLDKDKLELLTIT